MGRYSSMHKTAEELFLDSLIEARGQPISQKEVIEQTGLNRDTVYELSSKLEEAGKIQVEKKGRYTKYLLTIKALENLDSHSSIFAFYAVEDFLSPVESYLLGTDTNYEELSVKGTDDLETDIAEFCTRVGVLVLYTIIHALKKVRENNGLSSYEKDRIAEDTVEKIVSSIFPSEMLKCFTRWFSKYGEEEHVFSTLKALNNYLKEERSGYEYSKDFIDRMCRAFAEKYPSLNRRLQLIEKEIEIDTERMKKGGKQTPCKHQFKIKTVDGIRSKKCRKCGHKEILSIIRRENKQGDIVSIWYNGRQLP